MAGYAPPTKGINEAFFIHLTDCVGTFFALNAKNSGIYGKPPPSACRSKKRAKLLSGLGLISLDQDFPFCSQVNTGMCASQYPRALFSSTIIQISGAFFISFNGYIMRMKDVKRDTVELREHWSVIDICRGIRNHHILAHLHITCFMETRQRNPREKATLFYCCMLLSTVPMVRISITPPCRTSFYFVVHRKKKLEICLVHHKNP